MSVTVNIPVEDVTIQLETYASIQLETATSAGGTFSLLTTLTLVSGTYLYSYDDLSGTANTWYRYRLYNASGPVTGTYSNPFRPEGISLLKIRQKAIEQYRMGMVLSATAGSSTTSLLTTDFRFKTGTYAAGRGKNSAVRVSSGTYAGQMALVSNSSPSAGSLTIDAISGSITSGDQYEWTWMIDPYNLDQCVNRGLARYYFIQRTAIAGVSLQTNYPLDNISWLKNKNDITGLWWVPPWQQTEMPWVGGRRWYIIKDDSGLISLDIYPEIDDTVVLFLDAVRQCPELPTDDSVLPANLDTDLCAALAYDEVLSWLLRPGVAGTAEDRKAWDGERKRHAPRLLQLVKQNRIRPRWALPVFNSQTNVPTPAKARW